MLRMLIAVALLALSFPLVAAAGLQPASFYLGGLIGFLVVSPIIFWRMSRQAKREAELLPE